MMRPIVKTVGLICILFDCPDKNVIVDPVTAADFRLSADTDMAFTIVNELRDQIKH